MSDDAIRDALEADDPARFDPIAEALGDGLIPALVALVTDEERSKAAAQLGGTPISPRMEVGRLLALGRPGLWLGTEWAARMLIGVRQAPVPAHERWDALLELHAKRVEAAWLQACLFAGLDATQAALGRRMLIGVERRFSGRGVEIVRLRAGDGPLSDLLPPG